MLSHERLYADRCCDERVDFEQLRKARVLDLIQSESLFSPEVSCTYIRCGVIRLRVCAL